MNPESVSSILWKIIIYLCVANMIKTVIFGGSFSPFNAIKYGKTYLDWYFSRPMFSDPQVNDIVMYKKITYIVSAIDKNQITLKNVKYNNLIVYVDTCDKFLISLRHRPL